MRTRLVGVLLRDVDAVATRTLELAKFELIHGRAELLAELPGRLGAVTEDDVRSAAADAAPGPPSRPRTRRRRCPVTRSAVPDLTTAPDATRCPTSPRRAGRRSCARREATLDSGLRVVAVRKPGVPIVEMRLRLPFLSPKPAHPAQAMLLSDTLLTGAGDRDRAGLAADLQGIGADLSASVDADRLVLGGNVLATGLRGLLEIVAGVLTEASYPTGEVTTERDRLVERLGMARARAAVIAGEALAERMWDDHPYAHDLARPEAVAEVTRAQLRALHRIAGAARRRHARARR